MLLFADGFDAYGATADLIKKWSSNGAQITLGPTSGRFGGRGLILSSSAQAALISPVVTPNQVAGHIGVAFWFKATAHPTPANTTLIAISGVGASFPSQFLLFGPSNTGQIGFYNGPGATWGAGIGPNVCDNQWHWIEVLSTSGVTSYTMLVSLWVDGSQVIANFSIATGATTFGMQQLQIQNLPGCTSNIDDLILIDDQAGSQPGELVAASAFPIGPKRCETMWPSGVGTNTNWTPFIGANYAQVNENPTDWDISYVSSSLSGTRDSYAFPGSVQGINPLVAVVNCVAKNADAGSINIQGLTYSGSQTQAIGATVTTAVNSNPHYWSFVSSFSGAITSMGISLGAALTGNMKGAIYDNTGTSGNPGNVLGASAQVTNPGIGFNAFAFATPVAVVAGQTYWLSIHQDAAATHNITSGTTAFYNTDAYASYPVTSPTGLISGVAVPTVSSITISVVGLGDSKLASSAYTTVQFPIFRDPNTGLAWTKAGVNAAQFGVGVV